MKRKSLKKVLALAVASAMVLGFAGCGSSNSSTGTDTSTADTSTTDTSTADTSSTEETEAAEETPAEIYDISFSTIDLYAGSCNTGDYAEEIINQINEYTGVNLNLIWVSNDALSDKNSLYLANPSTMPNIITWGGTITGDVVSAAKAGAFVDLNDYVWDSDKYPNLSAMSKEVADTLTIDGQLIAIPRTRVLARYGLSYRTDWAEALGLAEPKTPDDVYDMLYAFTYNDPDGNGVDDTIGMEMTSYTGPFDIIQTWFGCGNGWAEVDGQLVPVFMQEEYMEAVDYIKKLYDDGLMPADWVSRPTDDWSEGCKRGDNGVYIDVMDGGKRIWKYFEAEETWTASVTNPDEAASMTLYGAVNGHTLATAGYNGYFTLSASTLDSPEKIEAALTLLDKLNDPEMLILTQYGLEGINYEYDANGYLVDLDVEDTVLFNNYAGLNQLLAFLPSTEETSAAIPIESDKYTEAQDAAYEAALPYAVINPASAYLANSPTYAADGAMLDENVSAARTQYICGEIDKAGLEAAIQQWKDQGGDQIITEVNEQYQASK